MATLWLDSKVVAAMYYRYIFRFLFETYVANSFILYRHFCTSHQPHAWKLKTYLDICLQLHKELVRDYCSCSRLGCLLVDHPPNIHHVLCHFATSPSSGGQAAVVDNPGAGTVDMPGNPQQGRRPSGFVQSATPSLPHCGGRWQ